MRVAFFTCGILQEVWGHPVVQGFVDRVDPVFAAFETAPGFIDQARGSAQEWGEGVYSAFIRDDEKERVVRTLSLWEDLESVAARAFSGPHAEAMKGRREWVAEVSWPTSLAWWVEDDHQPTWAEAAARHECLFTKGPTAEAFSLRQPFDFEGNPTTLDNERIKTIRL